MSIHDLHRAVQELADRTNAIVLVATPQSHHAKTLSAMPMRGMDGEDSLLAVALLERLVSTHIEDIRRAAGAHGIDGPDFEECLREARRQVALRMDPERAIGVEIQGPDSQPGGDS